MNHVRDAVHCYFKGNGDLLLDLLGGDARPLRDDFHIIVGHVGIRFDGKLMKRNCAPAKKQDRGSKHHEAVLEREIDKPANHFTVPPCSARSARSAPLALRAVGRR